VALIIVHEYPIPELLTVRTLPHPSAWPRNKYP